MLVRIPEIYKTRVLAIDRVTEINKELGFAQYNEVYVGPDLANHKQLPDGKGWYIVNRETGTYLRKLK